MSRKPDVSRLLITLAGAAVLVAAVALAIPRPVAPPPDPAPVAVPAPPPLEDPSLMSVAPDPVEAPPEVQAPRPARPVIEVAFVLDTTGSMAGLLEGAKQKIWSIASRIGAGQPRPELRVGIVAYRDVGDAYVTRVHDLSPDMDQVFANLKQLRADGGGDWPEHVGRALGEAVQRLSWSQDGQVLRMIFVVGDAPPQAYGDGWSATTWAKRAKQRGITVSAIRCGNAADTEVAFRRIAALAGGSFHSIGADGGMRAVTTPYDEELAEATRGIAEHTLYAGSAPARKSAEAKRELVAGMDAEAAADRVGFLAGKGAGASLAPAAPPAVADLATRPSKLDELAEDELPAELRALPTAQRRARVEDMARERRALEDRARELSRKRAAWLEAHAATAPEDAFDARVLKDVRHKAAALGVRF